MELEEELIGLRTEQPMGRQHPLGLGGTADYYFVAEDVDAVVMAVATCLRLQIPYIVLGGGGAVTFTDSGFPGLVIVNKSRGIAWTSDRSQAVIDAGITLKEMVLRLASKELGGLVPFYAKTSSLGAAVYGDERAGIQRLLTSVRYITVINPPDHRRQEATVSRQPVSWLQDGRRLRVQKLSVDSHINQPVLLSVTLQLTSLRQDELATRVRMAARATKIVPPGLFDPLWSEGAALGRLADVAAVGGLRFSKRFPGLVERQRGPASSYQLKELLTVGTAALSWESEDEATYGSEFLGVW